MEKVKYRKSQINYGELVIEYCSGKEKNSLVLAEMVSLVTVNSEPQNKVPFQQIMERIEQILASNDCKKIDNALGLLTCFYNIAQDDVLAIWRSKLGLLYKLKTKSFHFVWTQCSHCNSVSKLASELANIFTISSTIITNDPNPSAKTNAYLDLPNTTSKSECGSCKVSNAKLDLPCGHRYCKQCLVEKVRRAINTRERQLICHWDGKLIPIEWLKKSNVMDKKQDQMMTSSYSQTDETINCSKCHMAVAHYPQEQMFLAECRNCDYMFCTNCLEPYHGGTECSVINRADDITEIAGSNLADKNDGPDRADKTNTNISASPEALGATAMAYELDFYKPNDAKGAQKLFDAGDITAAFDYSVTKLEFPEIQSWPWEVKTRHYSYLDYNPPFQSLRAGNWVEDEILENAIKSVISVEKLDNVFCVLESYVSNWSNYCAYEDGELLKILEDKGIFEKQIIFTLINTDINGHGGHWILGVIHIPNNLILLLDSSLVLSPTFYQKFFFSQLHIMHVANALRKSKLDFTKWKFVVSLDSIQQENAYDCGPLVVANCYALTKNLQLNRMPNSSQLRTWIYEIVSNFRGNKVDWESPGRNQGTTPGNDIDKFMPNGLNIEYKFLNGKNVFQLQTLV